MERLTNNQGELPKCNDCIEESNCYSDISCNHMFDALKKLAEYEDLEEQCIKETTFSLRLLLKKWKEFFEDIQELYEYRKLAKQGLLLKLPCKVGDTVYMLNTLLSGKTIIGELQADIFFLSLCAMENRFGKTVFLTRPEAEEALKRMERED